MHAQYILINSGHCESSPGSFDECRLSAGWPPTLTPNQPIWAVSPLKDWLLPSADTIAIYYYYHKLQLKPKTIDELKVAPHEQGARGELHQLFDCLRGCQGWSVVTSSICSNCSSPCLHPHLINKPTP